MVQYDVIIYLTRREGMLKLSAFRKLRPKVEYGHVVSEVSVLLPKDIHSSQKSLQLSCPISITCGELKKRIEGVLNIPMTDYVLIFLGNILSDDEVCSLYHINVPIIMHRTFHLMYLKV